MNGWRSRGGRASPRWDWIAKVVIVVVAAILLWPYLPVLRLTPIPIWFVVGLVGFYIRGRVLDAALLLAAHFAAEFLGEPLFDASALAALSLSVLAVSGRPRFALCTGICLLLLFHASAELKWQFAGSALTWQDLRYFFMQLGDNIGVALSQPTVLLYGVAAILVFVVSLVWCWRSDRGSFDLKSQRPQAVHGRAVARLGAAVMAVWCGHELGHAATTIGKQGAWQFSETTNKRSVVTFLSTLNQQPVAMFHRVDTKLFIQAVRQQVDSSEKPSHLADIVLFLQESQFNPEAIDGCPAELCRSELFERHAETTDDGELRVHVYGGGTWLSEFAVNTGIPHTVFGRAGEYAPFNVAPGVNRSFVRSLKAAGYHTVAVYPVRGGMMNARAAYRAYGFDEFLDSTQVGLSGRFDTSDQAVHAAALRTLNRARQLGRPVFLMAVTIFNHSEHGNRAMPVPDALQRSVEQAMPPAVERDAMADYLWRTSVIAKVHTETKKAVLGSERPAVLAWFGDHQPPFAIAPTLRSLVKAGRVAPAIPDRFATWYSISSNRLLAGARPQRHRMDVALLPGLLAQRAGVPLDDWLGANVVARERCGGLLVECVEPVWRDAYYSFMLNDLAGIR